MSDLNDREREAEIAAVIGSQGFRTLVAGKIIDAETRDNAIEDLLRAALAAREEPSGLAMRKVKASDLQAGDDVVLAGEDERVKSVRHGSYGLIFIEDGNGREHEMSAHAMVLAAREDAQHKRKDLITNIHRTQAERDQLTEAVEYARAQELSGRHDWCDDAIILAALEGLAAREEPRCLYPKGCQKNQEMERVNRESKPLAAREDTERLDSQTTRALAVEALEEIGLVRVEIDLAESPYLLAVSQARNLGELLIEAADKLTHRDTEQEPASEPSLTFVTNLLCPNTVSDVYVRGEGEICLRCNRPKDEHGVLSSRHNANHRVERSTSGMHARCLEPGCNWTYEYD